MAFTNAGLNNSGRTRFFNVLYDDSLSSARGRDLAAALMTECDADFQWLQGFFPGVMPGTPMTVKLPSDAEADGGGSWSGWGPVVVEITLGLGESVVNGGDALAFVRYLLAVEVSEVFMRERQPAWFNRFNDWFEAFDEGSKGEALSRVIGVEFMRDRIPHAVALPSTFGFTFDVTDGWLNGTRASHIDTNPDDINPDDITGCAALFLLFLHDQLGFSIRSIIEAGGATLANVFSHLTGLDRSLAFLRFADLVNLHYPMTDGPYTTGMETAFPVPNLALLLASSQASWVENGNPYRLHVVLDRVATVNTTVHLSDDNPHLLDMPSAVTVPPGATSASVELTCPPQPADFAATAVTVGATYAGMTLTRSVQVVPPGDLILPALQIDIRTNNDPCQAPFTEGSELRLVVRNVAVLNDRHGLTYDWVVNGVASHAPVLVIPMLPPAGTHVSVDLDVRNSQGLHASGHYAFTTIPQLEELAELQRRVLCQVGRIQQVNVRIPPWVPIEGKFLDKELLDHVEKQAQTVAKQAEQLTAAIGKLRVAQAEAQG